MNPLKASKEITRRSKSGLQGNFISSLITATILKMKESSQESFVNVFVSKANDAEFIKNHVTDSRKTFRSIISAYK